MAPQPAARASCRLVSSSSSRCVMCPARGRFPWSGSARGWSTRAYRVARGAGRYSMRVPAQNPVDLGLDRAWECRVLERAGAAGLAPIVECCESRCGILVSRWVEGGAWTAEQAAQPENIEKIAQLARRVHSLRLPEAARTMRPEAWIAHYRQALARYAADAHPALQSSLEARLAALARLPPPAPVLCHSDLHVQNLIAADHGLVLLDWEYAHVSEPFWDLAGWAANNDLGARSRQLLLASYLGREPDGAGGRPPAAAAVVVRLRVSAVERTSLDLAGGHRWRAAARHPHPRAIAGGAPAQRLRWSRRVSSGTLSGLAQIQWNGELNGEDDRGGP